MTTENPSASPSILSPPAPAAEEAEAEYRLASRAARFEAAMIDGVTTAAGTFVLGLTAYGVAYLIDADFNLTRYEYAWRFIAIAVFLAMNARSLATRGQTIGKAAMKIKIVDKHGEIPSFIATILVRQLAFVVLSGTPVVGQWLYMLNILMIFHPSHRCLHDTSPARGSFKSKPR